MADVTGARVYIPALAPGPPYQYGLQSQATVITGDQRIPFAGVIHDVDDCHAARCWHHNCPEPVERTITVTLTGARTGTDPDFTYTISAKATIDPPDGLSYDMILQIQGTVTYPMSTDGPAVEVYSAAAPYTGTVKVEANGGWEATAKITQAAGGAVTPATITIPVEEPGPDPNDPKTAGQYPQDFVEAGSFTVYAASPPCMGRDALDRAQARATARLTAGEWIAVERTIFGSGGCRLPEDPWVNAEKPEGDTAVNMETALSALEYGMREYGGAGIIHAPRQSYPWWQKNRHIVRNGPRLETASGSGWAFGRGYFTAAPGQQTKIGKIDPNKTWIYASGAVRIWRSTINTPGNRDTTFDHGQNATRAVAERTYTVSIQCPIVAVNVDLEYRALPGGTYGTDTYRSEPGCVPGSPCTTRYRQGTG